MSRSDAEIERICDELLNERIDSSSLMVSLTEFQKFYTTLLHKTKVSPYVSLVNLETLIKAQFSNISPQHFDILVSEPLMESDFDFIIDKIWHGAKKPPENFLHFLFEEFRIYNWKLLLIFLVSVGILFVANSSALYELVSSLLIQSGTVFLSLYLIFTVSQSHSLYKDSDLFKKGVLQKYYADDRNITLLGILTIALTFLSSGIVSILDNLEPEVMLVWFPVFSSITKAIIVGVVIVLLFDTFFTVANYYLERNRDVIERDMASDVLDQDFQEFKASRHRDRSSSRN